MILSALAAGREVVISRGELVEIGGGFRVPDVMRQSGAMLREVGTTNRTRVTDYTAAVSPATAMFLRVHPSNFRIEGFTERPSLDDLVGAARAMNVPVVEDIGSGCLVDDLPASRRCRPRSPPASTWSASAATSCSADRKRHHRRPQALVDRLRTHPLMRALRADKITFACSKRRSRSTPPAGRQTTVPVQRMLHLAGRHRGAGAGPRRDAGRRRLARGDDERRVGGRRRQRAGTAVADRAAVDREGRRIARCRPSAGCGRSIRR